MQFDNSSIASLLACRRLLDWPFRHWHVGWSCSKTCSSLSDKHVQIQKWNFPSLPKSKTNILWAGVWTFWLPSSSHVVLNSLQYPPKYFRIPKHFRITSTFHMVTFMDPPIYFRIPKHHWLPPSIHGACAWLLGILLAKRSVIAPCGTSEWTPDLDAWMFWEILMGSTSGKSWGKVGFVEAKKIEWGGRSQ